MSRELISKPKIVSRGITTDTETIFTRISLIIEKRIKTYLRKPRIDIKSLTNLLADDISKEIYSELKKKPIVIPVLNII